MTKPRVFITREIFPEAIEMVEAVAEVDLWPNELPPSREALMERVSGVDGVLCLITDKVDAELMDAAGPQLKVISQIAVGYENIDIGEATRRGIPVGYTPGVLTHATADFAFTLLLAAGRRLVDGVRAVQSGEWRTWHPLHFLGREVHGSTLGLIGLGRIGLEVARRAAGFDMRVLYYNLGRREGAEREHSLIYADMETLLRESDFVSLHVNLTDKTYHLIGDEQLDLMKPTAVLVNTSRGPVVDPGALYRALRDGRIAAAGLDVTDPEPIPQDGPLLTLDNCIIAPHIASASTQARREMSRISAQNLVNGLAGKPLVSCVNPQVYGCGQLT